ncbi:5352_t:CDS:1, partial [Gigaspora margarita]
IEPYSTLSKLVIWDYKAQKYKLILNKNGKMTNQYCGRIFVEKLSRRPGSAPRYISVYKTKGPNPSSRRQRTNSIPKRRRNN